MAKKKITHEELLAKIRDQGESNDIEGWERTFAELAVRGDEKAVRYMLTIKPYNDVDDFDEMWQVIHGVEGFPLDVYLDGLIGVLGELCPSSGMLLEHLINRLTGRDEDTDALLAKLGGSSAKDRVCVKKLLQSSDLFSDPNPNRDRIIAALNSLPQSRT